MTALYNQFHADESGALGPSEFECVRSGGAVCRDERDDTDLCHFKVVCGGYIVHGCLLLHHISTNYIICAEYS